MGHFSTIRVKRLIQEGSRLIVHKLVIVNIFTAHNEVAAR